MLTILLQIGKFDVTKGSKVGHLLVNPMWRVLYRSGEMPQMGNHASPMFKMRHRGSPPLGHVFIVECTVTSPVIVLSSCRNMPPVAPFGHEFLRVVCEACGGTPNNGTMGMW